MITRIGKLIIQFKMPIEYSNIHSLKKIIHLLSFGIFFLVLVNFTIWIVGIKTTEYMINLHCIPQAKMIKSFQQTTLIKEITDNRIKTSNIMYVVKQQ